MQVIRTEAIMNNVKLCFLILSCIAEDQYANSLMHDANLAFRVQLHRVPMHHRKLQDKAAPAQPLAATLLGIFLVYVSEIFSKYNKNQIRENRVSQMLQHYQLIKYSNTNCLNFGMPYNKLKNILNVYFSLCYLKNLLSFHCRSAC